jgi:hypothetical protein
MNRFFKKRMKIKKLTESHNSIDNYSPEKFPPVFTYEEFCEISKESSPEKLEKLVESKKIIKTGKYYSFNNKDLDISEDKVESFPITVYSSKFDDISVFLIESDSKEPQKIIKAFSESVDEDDNSYEFLDSIDYNNSKLILSENSEEEDFNVIFVGNLKPSEMFKIIEKKVDLSSKKFKK